MHRNHKIVATIILGATTAVGVFLYSDSRLVESAPTVSAPIYTSDTPAQVAGAATATVAAKPKMLMPISVGLARVTKKPFGLEVTPKTSPVPRDIFTGFHTGIDFEVFENEQNTAVAITAACDGTVVLKQWARGYGGVLVQSCKIDNEDLTVIYGHMDLASISLTVGQTLKAGDFIGNLGMDQSHDTDGRRQHLHFDIHKGSGLDIRGYVPAKEDLANWIDPITYLQ